MKEKDPNYVVKLEKAVVEKYGDKAIVNPRGCWTEDDEKCYQEQLASGSFFSKNKKKNEEKEKEGYIIETSKLIMKEHRVCIKCKKYSMDVKDSLYLNKFGWCLKCYLDEEVILKWKGIITK